MQCFAWLATRATPFAHVRARDLPSWIGTAPVVPSAACAFRMQVLRWRRCPVSLHALTSPARIGTPSQTFLEWYGDESMCSRGPWRSFLSQTTGVRQ